MAQVGIAAPLELDGYGTAGSHGGEVFPASRLSVARDCHGGASVVSSKRSPKWGAMTRLVPGCGFLALALLVSAPASAERGKPIASRTITNQLRAGHAVVRTGVTVTGQLTLSGADVRAIFKCRGCTFAGRIEAPDATFQRTVDLSGSQFEGRVNFSGATFRAPALFRVATIENGQKSEERSTSFFQKTDFSLAVFGTWQASQDRSFNAAGTFRDTRFETVTFAGARFLRAGDFDRAAFRGTAIFNQGRFYEAGTFVDGDFRSGAHFAQAQFLAAVNFTGAQFSKGASFLNARFQSTESSAGARIQDITTAGTLDFTFASFVAGETSPDGASPIVIFSDIVGAQSVLFRNTTFADQQRITMHSVQARDLELGVDTVRQIDDEADQLVVLKSIEDSAKVRGDLADANDAHYALLVSQSQDYSAVWRALDYVFYRNAAGYFVRPFRPLVLLLVIVVAFSSIRFVRRPKSVETQHRLPRWNVLAPVPHRLW